MIRWGSEWRVGSRGVKEGLIFSLQTSNFGTVIIGKLGVVGERTQGRSPSSQGSLGSAAGGKKAGRLRWELVALATKCSVKGIYSYVSQALGAIRILLRTWSWGWGYFLGGKAQGFQS